VVKNELDHTPASGTDRSHRPIDAEIADVGSVAGGRVPLAGQAAEIIDESTTAVEVVSHLDCESYATEDQYPEWVDCKPFGAMLKSVLLAELTGASDAVMITRSSES
jgi:hypothetical protein